MLVHGIGDSVCTGGSGEEEVGDWGKKLAVGEKRAEREVKLLREGCVAELRQVASCSATHRIKLGKRERSVANATS